MEIVYITAEQADEAKQCGIGEVKHYCEAAIFNIKHRVLLDHALVRAMQDRSVPITDHLRDTKDLLTSIAENISKIDIINKRYEVAVKLLEHPVRARIETCSAQEFDQMVLHDKASILSNIKDLRVGDAVDFVMYNPEWSRVGVRTRARISRVYLDDNHNWVSAHRDPYMTTDWKASLFDTSTMHKSFMVD